MLLNIFTYILKKSIIENDLFNSILIGLCLMTETNEIFNFENIQPIFTTILPLLTEYYLQNIVNDDNYRHFISWLIGKMSHILIIGSPQDSLEIKYINKLKLPIFTGGYETSIIEKSYYLLIY